MPSMRFDLSGSSILTNQIAHLQFTDIDWSGLNVFDGDKVSVGASVRKDGVVYDLPLDTNLTAKFRGDRVSGGGIFLPAGNYDVRGSVWFEPFEPLNTRIIDTGWLNGVLNISGESAPPTPPGDDGGDGPLVPVKRHTIIFDMWSLYAGQAPVDLVGGLGAVLDAVNTVLPTGYVLADTFIEGDQLYVIIDELGTPAIPIALIVAGVVLALVVVGVAVISYQYFENEIKAKEENIAITDTRAAAIKALGDGIIDQAQFDSIMASLDEQQDAIVDRQKENGFDLGNITGILGLAIVASIAIALIGLMKK